MMTPIAQSITHASFYNDWKNFKENADQLEVTQKLILAETLLHHPYLKTDKDFRNHPIMTYKDMTEKLAAYNQPVVRYQPTSGSGDKEKLIPYTSRFIRQFNQALNPWLFDTCKKHPDILLGKHFWSISWLPTHWRKKGWQLDDFELLPQWKKALIKILMCVPNEVSYATTLEASQFATAAYLMASPELTFFSVWSPTFLLKLLELMDVWKEPLIKTIHTGKWQMFSDELSHLPAPRNQKQARIAENKDLQHLWPKLKLISSWNSSTSASWAEKLCDLFPGTPFQGKGLWATEGVVTIPFEGQFVLSYLSHYYEFLEIKSGNILDSWDLKEGMEVHPLLTCENGFIRYHLKDRLLVTGFYKDVPAFMFLERDNTFDMVGEKLDNHSLLHIHDVMKAEFPELKWVIAFAVNELAERPHYCFVFEGIEDAHKVKASLKKHLNEYFHYHLAQEIGQLGEEKVFIKEDAFARYENYQLSRGMVHGNIKVELAFLIKNEFEGKIFNEHFSPRT